MSRVYVAKDPKRRNRATGEWERAIDLTPARKFGELVFLLPDGSRPALSQRLVDELRHGLKDYSDNDYLLPVGDPALIALTAAIAARTNGGRLRLLCWDRLLRCYLASDVLAWGQA